jgi:nicotinate-nucleotide adenylyltransferase
LNIGIFGGTFNPIHYGHLRTAEEIRERLNLDNVIFIPSANPPHKEDEIIPFHHRYNMVKLSIKDNPLFSVSDIELKQSGSSYSIETIKNIRNIIGRNVTLFFIIGTDAFMEIKTWKNYRDLFYLCNFVVAIRPGYENVDREILLEDNLFVYDESFDRLIHISNNFISFIDVTFLDISSREIREKIRDKRSIKYLLPEEVENYIYKNSLYGV